MQKVFEKVERLDDEWDERGVELSALMKVTQTVLLLEFQLAETKAGEWDEKAVEVRAAM